MSEPGSDAEVGVADEPAAPSATGSGTTGEIAVLEQRIRRTRRWSIIAMVLSSAALVIAAVTSAWALSFYEGMFGPGPSGKDASSKIEAAIRQTYGASLRAVKARRVETDFDDEIPWPMSMMGGSEMPAYAVEYSLTGSKVRFASVLSGPESLGTMGFVPPRASLRAKLEGEDLTRLLSAYEQRSKHPIGAVHKYVDEDMMMSADVPKTIKVSGKEYVVEELWRVTEGVVVPAGEKVSFDMTEDLEDVVFRLDPDSGEFVYLGTEPSMFGGMPF